MERILVQIRALSANLGGRFPSDPLSAFGPLHRAAGAVFVREIVAGGLGPHLPHRLTHENSCMQHRIRALRAKFGAVFRPTLRTSGRSSSIPRSTRYGSERCCFCLRGVSESGSQKYRGGSQVRNWSPGAELAEHIPLYFWAPLGPSAHHMEASGSQHTDKDTCPNVGHVFLYAAEAPLGSNRRKFAWGHSEAPESKRQRQWVPQKTLRANGCGRQCLRRHQSRNRMRPRGGMFLTILFLSSIIAVELTLRSFPTSRAGGIFVL